MKNQIELQQNWKKQYEILWHNTPKKLRKTIEQINQIKFESKLLIAIFG